MCATLRHKDSFRMKMHGSGWTACVVLSLTIGSVFARDAIRPARPAAGARVISVRLVNTGGMCGGDGYCTQITTIDRSFVLLELKDAPNKKKFPNSKIKRGITERQ